MFKSYKDLVCATFRLYISENPPKEAEVETAITFFYVKKNLGMYPLSKFWDTIFSSVFNTQVYLGVSFSEIDIITLKEEELFDPKMFMRDTTIKFFD